MTLTKLTICLQEGSTDHNPILAKIGEENEESDTYTKRYTDWEKYKTTMDRHIGPLPQINTEENIEEAINHLEDSLNRATQNATTITTIEGCRYELPNETIELIRERRRARRRAQQTRTPEDKREANRLNLEVKEALRRHENTQWARLLDILDPTQPGLWNLQKVLKTDKKPIPSIHGENGIVCNPEEKAEAFADCLERECRENYHSEEDE